MSREFTITNDPSWISGSISGVTVYRPVIQHVNSIPSLKNTNFPYIINVGEKKLE